MRARPAGRRIGDDQIAFRRLLADVLSLPFTSAGCTPKKGRVAEPAGFQFDSARSGVIINRLFQSATSVDDRTFFIADLLPVPFPRFGIDGSPTEPRMQ